MRYTNRTGGLNAQIKVLLVDDDARYLELVEMMLEGEGFAVVSDTSGMQLEKLVDEHSPHVIVLDIILSKSNGIDLAQQFRSSRGNADIPIVFVSAWTGKMDQKLLTNSIRVFKPFTQTEICSAIRSVLGHEKGVETKNA